MWESLLVKCSNLLPNFNDFLLRDFRRNKIRNIKSYLDVLFRESVKRFDGRLKYNGYTVLTPDEQLAYIRTNKILKKKVQILDSTFELVRYAYEFKGECHYIHVFVPFLRDNKVVLGSTSYYPLFPEVEAGGLHRTHTEIILKVLCAPIMLYRNSMFSFVTSKGKIFKEVVNQVRIHQGKNGRSKNAGRVPIILYHLVKKPFYECMRMYKFKDGEIDIVSNPVDDPAYSYIKIKGSIFLKVADEALGDIYKRRVIASYLMCLDSWNHFLMRELLSPESTYYKAVLGRLTYSNIVGSDTDKTLMYIENAIKHLKTTDVILDPPAQYQLSQVQIFVSNIYEFLYQAFYNMDRWMVNYSPISLYDKKIGSLDSLLAELVSKINKRLFNIVNAKDEELTRTTVKSHLNRASQFPEWIGRSPSFRANPSFCNDNWLITVGTKRFRSLENIETAGATAKGKGKSMKASLLAADPSQLVVESACAVPPSSPVVSGEINPFVVIDENGQIIPPPWKDEIATILD